MPLNLTLWPIFVQYDWYINLNIFFDVLFFLDFLLMFFSSTVLPNGRESFDSHEVCWSYLTMTRFFVDSLSLLGTFPFQKVSGLRLFTLLKIIRVFRIADIIRKGTMTTDAKAFLNIGRLILYLYLYIHIVGCLLYAVTQIDAPNVFVKDLKRDGHYYPFYDWENSEPYMIDADGQFCAKILDDCVEFEGEDRIDRKFGVPNYNRGLDWKRLEVGEEEPISGKSADEFNDFWEGRHS